MNRTTTIIATVCTIFLAATPGLAQSTSSTPIPRSLDAEHRGWPHRDRPRLDAHR